MSRYHLPSCLTAGLVVLATGGIADAKPRGPDGNPCDHLTSREVQARNGGFEIVARPVVVTASSQPASMPIGQSVRIDRALLSQIALSRTGIGR